MNTSTGTRLALLFLVFSDLARRPLAFSVSAHRGLAHDVRRRLATTTQRSIVADRHLKIVRSKISSTRRPSSEIFQSLEPNDGDASDVDNFDAKGFGNYLGPYALALLASVGVTFAFVKFVLLDY